MLLETSATNRGTMSRSTLTTFGLLLLLLTAPALTGCPSPNGDGGSDMGASADDGTSEDMPSGAEVFDTSDVGWLLHVTGRGSDDIYVVGGTPEEGTMKHWDGSDWSDEDLPDGTPLLNWVQLFDDGTAITVGNGGTVLHNDGTGWSEMDSGTEEDLWGVWGASTDDVWAVGGAGREEGQDTIIRYDGAAWSRVTVPELERPGVNAFFKVWGTGHDNVYIVGQRGAVLQWDGQELVEHLVGTSDDLIALWGTGPDNIFLVGGRGNGVLSRWDGAEWHTESLAPMPGINGLSILDDNLLWVAGVRGTLRKVTVEDDGTFSWEREPPVTEVDLHAVYTVEGYGLLAVGGNFDQPGGPYEAAAIRRAEGWQ